MAENEKVIVVQKTANQLFRTKKIWQYDVGHTLRFDGFSLPNTFQVHFASSPTGDSIPQIGQDGVCAVPAQFARNSGTIYAWVYIAETETGLTKYQIEIPVEARGAITNQEPTPVEQSVIDQAIAALNAGVTAAESAQEAAETAQTGAESARDDAVSAATRAANSATDANSSREAADQSATNAGVSERNAKSSETAAAGSASAAAQSATTASQKAEEASGYAQGASGSAQTAQTAAQTATTKAGEASQSASAAAQKAQEAASSATSASQSATSASTAKTAAETAKADAVSAKNDAQTAANSAAGSATSASGSASAASQSATAAAGSATAAAQSAQALSSFIDDTAGVGDSTKVWSADKSATERNSVMSAFTLQEENVPGTTQTISFDSVGNVSQIVHSANGVAVRTDVFTFGTNTITEVRTLSTGESLTIVTNTDTLVATTTYADAA